MDCKYCSSSNDEINMFYRLQHTGITKFVIFGFIDWSFDVAIRLLLVSPGRKMWVRVDAHEVRVTLWLNG